MELSAEEEFGIETPFVGRTAYLNKLNNAWHKQIIGLYGLRAIGKSRTIKEFFKGKTKRKHDDENLKTFSGMKEIIVDMRNMRDSVSLHINLCVTLEIEPVDNADENKYKKEWKRQIKETILSKAEVLHLILFDNAEDVMDGPLKDEFLELVSTYLITLKNVKQFITSTTKAMFARIQSAYFTDELKPMPPYEASELLDKVTPGVNLGEYKEAIVRLCEGLPLVILMVGSELTAEDGEIEPKEMVEFLTECRLHALSRENYPEEDRVGDVYKKFINRLTEKHQQRLAILGYIPGTFDAEEARAMLDHTTVAVAKVESLLYYRARSMITHDISTRRFDIQGILRECLDVYNTIKDLPEIRRRYCETFVKVMKTLCRQLGTEEYTKALSQFSQEQPNLQKLLTEVYHSTNETYPYFIKIAADCTELIERFMSKESQRFYDGCLNLANQFGRIRDMATVHIAIGSMYTNAKGEFTTGGESYVRALELIRDEEKTLQLATLYQRLGYNLYTRGIYAESITYLKEAFDIHLHLKTDRTPLAFQTFNSLGIVYNAMGNFDEAKRYFFESLRRREITQGKDHHGVGATKNNIGLMYDLMGDHELALKYYSEGLEIKQKSSTPTWSLVYSMNNIANMYRSMKLYTEANSLLEQAMQKLNEEESPHKGAVSLTYDTLGKVLLSQEKYKQASDMFEIAAAMRKDISANGVAHVESITHLAKAQQKMGNHIFAEKLAKEVIALSDATNRAMPTNTFVSDTLEVLRDIYNSVGESERVKLTIELLQSELLRQERIYMGSSNTRRVNEITTKLSDIHLSLHQL